jgi:hypothetical protein
MKIGTINKLLVFMFVTILMVMHSNSKADSLSGTFSTKGFSSEYYVVVWIKNQAGAFVKTLAVWGRTSTSGYWSQMPAWTSASSKNVVDAVSAATLTSNKTGLKFSWNGTDKNKAKVANGTYSLQIESVENNNKVSTSSTEFVFDGTSKAVTGKTTTKITPVSFNILGNSTNVSNLKQMNSRNSLVSISNSVVKISSLNDNVMNVGLYSLDGACIRKWNFENGVNGNVSLNLKGIKNGHYLLTVDGANTRFSKNLMLLNSN